MISQHPEQPSLQVEHAVLQNARAVHDTAALRLSDYETIGDPSWVLVVLTPASDSGSATVPGGYVDAETGIMVIPENSETVVVKNGGWRLQAATHPAHPTSGTYAWTEPLDRNKRTLEPEDFYSPFIHGGTLLFQPNPAGKNIDQFKHPRVIFSQWKEMVQPAFAHSTQISGVLDGCGTNRDSGMLADLISQSNALLSVLALRESLRLRSIAPKSSRDLLHGVDHRVKALFVYLMLSASSSDQQGDWLNQISHLVKEARSLEDLHAFGLGAFAAALFQYQDAEIVAGAKTVLATVKKRLVPLQVPHEKNPQLYFILDRSGID